MSQNMPCPVAAEVVHLVQVMSSTPQPLSAHASVMAEGRMLRRCGNALVQSATTPGGEGGVDGGELAGEIDAGGEVVTGDGAIAG